MTELGIILDFKDKVITIDIDEIKLPMRSIDYLPSSNKESLSFNSRLANYEPKSTELATQRVVKYWMQNMKKQISQKLLKIIAHI
jgi:hypothetical protein